MLRMLIASLLVFSASASSVMAQTNPVCVYPQWLWGSTGNIYHYYSELAFDDGENPPEMVCQCSYWGNWDSGNGTEDTNAGCLNDGAPCEVSGFPAANPNGQEPRTVWGPESFASNGYGGQLLAESVVPQLNLNKNVKIKPNTPPFFVKINFDDESYEYYKLFDLEITAKRKKLQGPNPNPNPNPVGEPRSVTSRYGVQVSESAAAIEVDKENVREIKGKGGQVLEGVFLLDLGPRTFVLRRHSRPKGPNSGN